MWLFKLIDFVADIPNNILFAVSMAWLFASWPFRLLWYRWQVYQANRDLQRYLHELRGRSYYDEEV